MAEVSVLWTPASLQTIKNSHGVWLACVRIARFLPCLGDFLRKDRFPFYDGLERVSTTKGIVEKRMPETQHPTPMNLKDTSSILRMNSGFPRNLHILHQGKNHASTAWLLYFRNPLHRFFCRALWMGCM